MKQFVYFRLALISVCCCIVMVVHSQQHDPNALKAAKVLHLQLDSLANGRQAGIYVVNVKGHDFSVKISKAGTVEHIGIPLFSSVIRMLQPSPIYDYLEYVALDHKYHVSENNLLQQQLKFRVGDWTTLEQVTDSMECLINNVEDKYYEVVWKKEGHDVVSVNFPINYELLANSNRKNILEKFVTSLRQYTPESSPVLHLDSIGMKPYNKDGVYVHLGDNYTVPEINTNTYFRSKKGEESGYEWLKDKRYPAETFANRLLSPGTFPGNPPMKVVCILYNHRKETVNTTLASWMSFCQEQGCKPYYGFETDHQGKLTATLIMRNRESGYDHIVTVSCQRDQLEDESPQIDAVAYLFTPSSNVSDLFHNASKPIKKKKIILK